MLLTQIIERNAQIYGQQSALNHNGKVQTWGQLRDRISRMASALSTQGVRSGDKVALLALNSDHYIESFFAVLWLGGVIVPLNTRWSETENKYAVDDAQVSHLIVDATFAAIAKSLQAKCNSLVTMVGIGSIDFLDGQQQSLFLEAVIDAAESIVPVDVDDSVLAGVFYTGGTTGFPKGVMLSNINLWSSAVATVQGYNLNAQPVNFLHALPLFHIAGVAGFLACSLIGAQQYFSPTFEPTKVIDVMEQGDVSHVMLVPTMIAMLLTEQGFNSQKLSSLKQIIYGASPILESTLNTVMQRLPEVEFYQGYGQTEVSPAISILGPKEHNALGREKLRSAGQACVCVQISIRSYNGTALAAGEVGEVAIKGPNVMMGYLNKAEETKEVLSDGWLLTGDIGYLDADGYLFLLDRAKDMIVTGAENVFSAEVENVISTYPGVDSVAVIGIPSEEWGESVHAIIVTQEDLEESDIIAHCRSQIAGYKCPKSIEFKKNLLPMSPAGKILKVELRKPYWQEETRSVG